MLRPSVPSTFRRGLLALAAAAQLAAATCGVPTLASAEEALATRDAAALKARADAAMDSGAFADAISGYRASYEASRNPALLYNIGNAYDRLGDYPRALAYLEQFAHVASSDLKARVPRLDQLIESVRGKLARVAVHCNVSGARIFVRGAWMGTTPLATELVAMPGSAEVEVTADGYRPFGQDVALVAGGESRLDVVLVNDAAFAPTPTEPTSAGPITTRWWFWTGVGLVVVGGATALTIALTRERDAPSGDIAPGRVAAPIVAW